MLLTHTHCPVCRSSEIKEVMQATDYTVSKERFGISACATCQHRFTNPVPDQASIGPYYKSEAYVSHTNTSKGFVNRAYQVVRKWTLRRKLALMVSKTGRSTGSLLDIGSGAGAFLSTMRGAGWQTLGLEPDPDARAVAQRDFGVEARPVEELMQLEEGVYDAVTMWHVLEHVHELEAYMKKIHRLLKTEGRFFVAVPNHTSWDARKYGKTWAAYDVPRHVHHFSPASMQRLLEDNGFKLLEMRRMPFDSFYVSLLTERNTGGNMLSAFWNGFCSYVAAIFDRRQCSSLIYVIRK